ncbi:hypothetical protein UlMin_010660 [Ulmus minor]
MGSSMSSKRRGCFDFQDFQAFNRVMVAKQCWRLVLPSAFLSLGEYSINVWKIFSAKVELQGLGGFTEEFRHQLRMVDLKARLGIIKEKSDLRASLDAIAFEDTELKNTGLERSESLAKDLEWFKKQGYAISEPSAPAVNFAEYLKELSEKDPQAFIFHFYNIYFAHSAGHLYFLLFQVAEKILNGKGLEFYKWDGNLSQLLQNVREKLNKVVEIREEKNHCLEEIEKSFKYSGGILRLILL